MNSANQSFNEINEEQAASSWPNDDQNQLIDDPTSSLFFSDRNHVQPALPQSSTYQSYSSIPSQNAKIQKPNHPNSTFTKRRLVSIPISIVTQEHLHHPYASTTQPQFPFLPSATTQPTSHLSIPTYSSPGSLHPTSDALVTPSTYNLPHLHHQPDTQFYNPNIRSTSQLHSIVQNNQLSPTNFISDRSNNLPSTSSTRLPNVFPTHENQLISTSQPSSLPITDLNPTSSSTSILPFGTHHLPTQVSVPKPTVPPISPTSSSILPQAYPLTHPPNLPPFPMWPIPVMGEPSSHQPFSGYLPSYPHSIAGAYTPPMMPPTNHPGNTQYGSFQTPNHSQQLPAPIPYNSPMYPPAGYVPMTPIPGINPVNPSAHITKSNTIGQTPIPGMASYYPYYGYIPGPWNYDPRNTGMWTSYGYGQPHGISTSCKQPMIPKKKRLQWTPELHAKFVAAVEEAGVEQAVPKLLLQAMQVPGLTRENVASHLQKYREGIRKKKSKEFKEQKKLLKSAAEHEHEHKEDSTHDGESDSDKKDCEMVQGKNCRTDNENLNQDFEREKVKDLVQYSADNENDDACDVNLNTRTSDSDELSVGNHDNGVDEHSATEEDGYDNEQSNESEC